MKRIYAITGGASGMGLATAEILGKRGAVLIGGRTESKIEKALDRLKEEGVEAYGQVCDVSDFNSVKQFAEKAAATGELAGAVNAAGIAPDMGDPEKILRINMLGTKNTVEAFFPFLGSGGTMVNIASMMGHMMVMSAELARIFAVDDCEEMLAETLKITGDSVSAYSISKRFVLEYTCQNTARFAKNGARIVSVSPGAFDTPLLISKEDPSIVMTVKMTPLSRMGRPEEVGGIIDFVVSEKGAYFTGCDFRIDGGFTAAQIYSQL